MKSFAIIGLGLFGSQLARELYESGYSVLAIDSNENIIEDIADNVTQAVATDATDRKALSQLGISKYDCAVVGLSSDLAKSVLITMNLKALGVNQIVCKVRSETDREVLTTLGATSCIVPEHIAANNLAKRLTNRNLIDFLQLTEDHSIIEINIPESWVNKSIAELNVRAQYSVNVIGIKRDGKLYAVFNPNDTLSPTDRLVIIGLNSNLDKMQKLK